jgi:protoheme IX farnesyltransferase
MNGRKITFSQGIVFNCFQSLKHYLEMLKMHLCLYIGLSAIFGHVMAQKGFSINSFLLGFFVFILACGSAVLNNIQDRNYDSFFSRTCDRSLPQKRVSIFHAKVIATLMIGCGLSGLLLFMGFPPLFWGVMAVICYNAIYTPLKKRFLLAIIPGSLSGMFPPLIGWTAAGSGLSDLNILMIMSVFGLWQIPHFFIILLKTRKIQPGTQDLNRFPCFTKLFSENEIKLQILIWTSLYSLAILLFLINRSIENHLLSIIGSLNAIGIIFLISTLMFKNEKQNILFAFAAMNLSMLFFMGVGICDKGFI